jgi:hypothetical protein
MVEASWRACDPLHAMQFRAAQVAQVRGRAPSPTASLE